MPADIWKAFTTEGCEPKWARCLFCDKLVSRGNVDPKKQTTSGLKYHVNKEHAEEYNKLLEESKNTTGNGNCELRFLFGLF